MDAELRRLRDEQGVMGVLVVQIYHDQPGYTLQERKLDHNEFLDVVLVEPAELMRQIKAGEVSDVKTIIGAFWVA